MRTIEWKLSLKTSPEEVYAFINSDEGRANFWAESAVEKDLFINFQFINGWEYQSKILQRIPGKLFQIDYFNSEVTFNLTKNSHGGTDFHLVNKRVAQDQFLDVLPGWVSVLMNLKAALDFKLDLRNHNASKTWDHGYVDV